MACNIAGDRVARCILANFIATVKNLISNILQYDSIRFGARKCQELKERGNYQGKAPRIEG